MKPAKFRFSLKVLFLLVTYCAFDFAFTSAVRHERDHKEKLQQLEIRLNEAASRQFAIERYIGGRSLDTFASDPDWRKANVELMAIRKQLVEERDR